MFSAVKKYSMAFIAFKILQTNFMQCANKTSECVNEGGRIFFCGSDTTNVNGLYLLKNENYRVLGSSGSEFFAIHNSASTWYRNQTDIH